MIGYDYNLDLLGVRFDAEMELKAFHELAEEIAEQNRGKSDFEKNCKKAIKEKISYESDREKVWKILKENYMRG